MKAKANIEEPQYKNNVEKKWADEAQSALISYFGQTIEATSYEPITFNLPGVKYTPDFMHILEHGDVVFVEVKSSAFGKAYATSITKLKVASKTFPWFFFIEVKPHKKKGDEDAQNWDITPR